MWYSSYMTRKVIDGGFVYLSLTAEGSVELAELRWTRDLGRSLYQAHYRGRRQLVVAAVNCNPETFERLSGVELPWVECQAAAAERFGQMTVDVAAEPVLRRHWARLDPDVRGDLAEGWAEWGGFVPWGVFESAPRVSRETLSRRDGDPPRLNPDAYAKAWQMVEAGHGVSIIQT